MAIFFWDKIQSLLYNRSKLSGKCIETWFHYSLKQITANIEHKTLGKRRCCAIFSVMHVQHRKDYLLWTIYRKCKTFSLELRTRAFARTHTHTHHTLEHNRKWSTVNTEIETTTKCTQNVPIYDELFGKYLLSTVIFVLYKHTHTHPTKHKRMKNCAGKQKCIEQMCRQCVYKQKHVLAWYVCVFMCSFHYERIVRHSNDSWLWMVVLKTYAWFDFFLHGEFKAMVAKKQNKMAHNIRFCHRESLWIWYLLRFESWVHWNVMHILFFEFFFCLKYKQKHWDCTH